MTQQSPLSPIVPWSSLPPDVIQHHLLPHTTKFCTAKTIRLVCHGWSKSALLAAAKWDRADFVPSHLAAKKLTLVRSTHEDYSSGLLELREKRGLESLVFQLWRPLSRSETEALKVLMVSLETLRTVRIESECASSESVDVMVQALLLTANRIVDFAFVSQSALVANLMLATIAKTSITALDFSSTERDEETVSTVASILRAPNSRLRSLSLSMNLDQQSICSSFYSALGDSKALETLVFRNCDLDFGLLVPSLERSSCVTTLKFSGTKHIPSQMLLSLVRNNKSITTLEFEKMQPLPANDDGGGYAGVVQSFQANQTLERVRGVMALPKGSVTSFLLGLSHVRTLRELVLPIRSKVYNCGNITNCVQNCPSLTSLQFCIDELGSATEAAALGAALQRCTSLTHFAIGATRDLRSDNAVLQLLSGLAAAKTLRSLHLERIRLVETVSNTVANILEQSPNFQHLKLVQSGMNGPSFFRVLQGLSSCKALQTVQISSASFEAPAQCADLFTATLQGNPDLDVLDLSDFPLNGACLSAIIHCLDDRSCGLTQLLLLNVTIAPLLRKLLLGVVSKLDGILHISYGNRLLNRFTIK